MKLKKSRYFYEKPIPSLAGRTALNTTDRAAPIGSNA